jgi:hypothetical protein
METISLKDYPDNIGKKRKLTSIDGKKSSFIVEDEIIREQEGSIHRKLIYLQKIKHEPDGRLEYRFTYYMEGLKGRTKGRWVFGQYSLMIPQRDLTWLLNQARKKEWKGF